MELDFLNQIHEIRDFSPFDQAMARFDATCNPSGGYFNATVKVRWDFSFGWSVWNLSRQSAFKTKYKEMINSYWSGRYAVTLTGDTDDRKVTIAPSFSIVDDDANAHFTLHIQRLSFGRSFVQGGDAGPFCKLYSGAVDLKPNGFFMRAGFRMAFGEWGHDRTILAQAKTEFERFARLPIPFNRDSEDPADPNRPSSFAAGAKAIMSRQLPLIPMEFVGYHLPGEPAGLGRRRAERFVRRVEEIGFPRGFLSFRDAGPAPGKSPADQSVSLGVQLRTEAAERSFLAESNNFPIAAHEFGHQLGLPDEYEAPHPVINNFARGHQIAVPAFEKNTSSLMSMGDHFLPFHYVPVVAALEKMLADFRTRAVPGTTLRNAHSEIRVGENLLVQVKNLYRENAWLRDFANLVGM